MYSVYYGCESLNCKFVFFSRAHNTYCTILRRCIEINIWKNGSSFNTTLISLFAELIIAIYIFVFMIHIFFTCYFNNRENSGRFSYQVIPEGRVSCFSGVAPVAFAGFGPAHGLIVCARIFRPCDFRRLCRVPVCSRLVRGDLSLWLCFTFGFLCWYGTFRS